MIVSLPGSTVKMFPMNSQAKLAREVSATDSVVSLYWYEAPPKC